MSWSVSSGMRIKTSYAVFVAPDHLALVPDQTNLGAHEVACIIFALFVIGRNDQQANVLADDLPFKSEKPLGRLVEALDGAIGVEGDNALGGVVEDGLQSLLT